MYWQRVRVALLTGVLVAAAAPAARAGDEKRSPRPDAHPAPAAAHAAPAAPTVCVTEWVPEQYETVRTVHRTVCVQEKYTAFRTECAPQVQKRVVTVNRVVPE